jgi:hypothetical protein
VIVAGSAPLIKASALIPKRSEYLPPSLRLIPRSERVRFEVT